jgi:hypothetical protein
LVVYDRRIHFYLGDKGRLCNQQPFAMNGSLLPELISGHDTNQAYTNQAYALCPMSQACNLFQ